MYIQNTWYKATIPQMCHFQCNTSHWILRWIFNGCWHGMRAVIMSHSELLIRSVVWKQDHMATAYDLVTSLCHIHLMGYCIFVHQPWDPVQNILRNVQSFVCSSLPSHISMDTSPLLFLLQFQSWWLFHQCGYFNKSKLSDMRCELMKYPHGQIISLTLLFWFELDN